MSIDPNYSKPCLINEYYLDNNILYLLSSKNFDTMKECVEKTITENYGYKTYMSHTDNNNHCIINFVNNNKIFYVIYL